MCSSSFCIPYWELLVPLLPLLSTAAKFKSRSCLAGGGDGGLRWSQALKEGKHACQTCTTRIGLGALQHYNFSLAVTHFFFFPPSFSLLLLCWPSSSSSSNHLKHFGACTWKQTDSTNLCMCVWVCRKKSSSGSGGGGRSRTFICKLNFGSSIVAVGWLASWLPKLVSSSFLIVLIEVI